MQLAGNRKTLVYKALIYFFLKNWAYIKEEIELQTILKYRITQRARIATGVRLSPNICPSPEKIAEVVSNLKYAQLP